MIKSSRHETESSLQIKLPWDSNTAKGFTIGIVSLCLFLLIAPFLKIEKARPRKEKESVPIKLLIFGSGDGTGLRSGNLTEEGKSVKGKEQTMNIQDAQVTARNNKNNSISENVNSSRLTPVKDLGSKDDSKTATTGSAHESVGKQDGSLDGTGLRNTGRGRGAGDGFGDVDWGGGGNRVVTHKVLPRFPKGIKTSAQIELKFKVLPDGTVGTVIPLKKADPSIEKAAIDAIKQWRFNPLKEDMDMWGVIPLTFLLR